MIPSARIPGDGPQSVAALLDRPLRNAPGAEAVVSRYARLTFAELDAAVARAAGVLSARGIGRGDRVGGSMGNHAELVVAFLAAMRIGAIWIGINRSLAAPEVEFLLDDADVALVVADDATAALIRAAGRVAIAAEPGAADSEWAVAMAAAEPEAPGEVDPFAPAAIAYTSGTTGRPKGVVHSQHNLLVPGAIGALAAEASDVPSRPGVCLPLTILNLMVLGPVSSYQRGTPCILMDRVDAVGIAEWVRDERLTTFAAVPAMVYDLLTHPDVTEAHLRTLVRPGVGGADCPTALRELYEKRYGVRITTGYGLTEAPTGVTREDPALPPVPGSAGRALPHVSITIRDEDGRVLAAGETGEICVSAVTEGPLAGVYTPMLGYWNRPDATAHAFHDDGTVLRTGDIGHLGPEGDLFITDRKNDLILRGGANVYPAEVERVLAEIGGVAACSVVGLPDDRLGERVVAAVVAEAGAGITADVLRERCSAELARYKVPETFLLVDELPRNAMGKVVKRQVIELFTS